METGEDECHGEDGWSLAEGRWRWRRRRNSVMKKVDGDGGGRGSVSWRR